MIPRSRPRLTAPTLTLRTAIGLAFTLILLLSGGGLIWLDHHATLHLLQQQVDGKFDGLVADVTSRVSLQFSSADAVLDTLAATPPPAADPEAAGVALARVLADLAETAPSVLSIVTAAGGGDYILVHREPGRGEDRRGPAYEVHIGEDDAGRASERVLDVDASFAALSRRGPVSLPYDARTRPWYTMATGVPHAVTTPLYPFRNGRHYGFTLSRRTVDDPSRVFGVDIRLDSLSASLQRSLAVPGEHVAIFSPDGALLGDSDRLQIDSPLDAAEPPEAGRHLAAWRIDAAAYAAYRKNPGLRDAAISVDGITLYANIARIAVNGADMVVASTVPAARFEAPATRLLWWSLAVQGAVIALAFVLVSVASRSIARPIGTLAADVEHIIHFRFPERARPPSRIREIRRLAAAVGTLDLTLRAFSTYLPQGFVRTIVAGGRAPGLGGRRQPLAVMFTDIEGFTGLSEALAPDALLSQLSRYFAVISDEILQSGGTLDKFIGDSVMAFWPLTAGDAGRAGAVCRAVLRASRRLEALNGIFAAEGLPVLPTRFGLNTGEALLGSVGTPERMNYTVLGHTVNVASRIEQLNKDYGTRILVGGALREAAGPAFRFRYVAAATVRGTQDHVELFELLGEVPEGSGQEAGGLSSGRSSPR